MRSLDEKFCMYYKHSLCSYVSNLFVIYAQLHYNPLSKVHVYRGADKSLARPGRKQATVTEDFEFHISYL